LSAGFIESSTTVNSRTGRGGRNLWLQRTP
jgi:hypothetical protein